MEGRTRVWSTMSAGGNRGGAVFLEVSCSELEVSCSELFSFLSFKLFLPAICTWQSGRVEVGDPRILYPWAP